MRAKGPVGARHEDNLEKINRSGFEEQPALPMRFNWKTTLRPCTTQSPMPRVHRGLNLDVKEKTNARISDSHKLLPMRQFRGQSVLR
jgi:hypothetical protein